MQKSGFPYLVDISVGDYCTFGCPFCYTSSTKKGSYADGNNTIGLARVLYESNVFNVVFGGGEPTLYNNKSYKFEHILQNYASYKFVIGVTTKNYEYYKKDSFTTEMEMINSLAVSCQTIEDLERVTKISEKAPCNTTIYIQTILGATPQEYFEKFIKRAKELGFYRITLLGFKDFGFGTTYESNKIDDSWMDFVKDSYLNIGVDSIIANKYGKKLIKHGVPHYALVGKEGLNTCYIDTLKMVVKPSSFCNEEYPILGGDVKTMYGYSSRHFLETFAKF